MGYFCHSRRPGLKRVVHQDEKGTCEPVNSRQSVENSTPIAGGKWASTLEANEPVVILRVGRTYAKTAMMPAEPETVFKAAWEAGRRRLGKTSPLNSGCKWREKFEMVKLTGDG